jgi:small subunit ribosomal protein S9
MAEQRFYATGKRKTAIARVWMKAGSGNWIVNDKTLDDYFPGESLRMLIQQPLDLVGKRDGFDFYINVKGGGPSGQAGAVKHGISKVLSEYDVDLRSVLRKAGFLTRDAREKERKKYGQPGARKRFQYSKR